jgi:hypothetical protein
MSKYDEKLVDELLSAIDRNKEGGEFYITVLKAAEALKPPKPKKFYIMPEWETFLNIQGIFVINKEYDYYRFNGILFAKEQYNAIREATALEKL